MQSGLEFIKTEGRKTYLGERRELTKDGGNESGLGQNRVLREELV